jgi:hypothetical protein
LIFRATNQYVRGRNSTFFVGRRQESAVREVIVRSWHVSYDVSDRRSVRIGVHMSVDLSSLIDSIKPPFDPRLADVHADVLREIGVRHRRRIARRRSLTLHAVSACIAFAVGLLRVELTVASDDGPIGQQLNAATHSAVSADD